MDKLSEKMKTLIENNLPDNITVVFCETDEEREAHIGSADALVTFTEGVSKKWIEKAKVCNIIQKLGAGVNNIDIGEASRRGIAVSNARGMNSRSVAEHAVLLMLSIFKQLIPAHNGIVLSGSWLKTDLRDSSYQLTRKKVGLIGLGEIGREVAKILTGFECEISYFDIYRLNHENEERLGIQYMQLKDLIKHSDVISLHVPLTQETHHLINHEYLNLMKSTAILINTCRGGVIDEEALYEALKTNIILGAGLDVFEQEPIDQNHRLASLNNVVLTPHIGGGTVEAMEAVIAKSMKNISHYLTYHTFYDEQDIINLSEVKQVIK